MDNEQYSNMVDVEGFSNKDTNAVDEKIKEKSVSGKKNSIAHIISILLILLGLAIIISYLGATLLFFIWSIGTECSKNKNKELFEYIFPTSCEGEGFCKKKQGDSQTDGIELQELNGGSSFSGIKSTLNEYKGNIDNYFKDIKECVRKNKSINSFCNTTNISSQKINWNNPGLYEWFLKSYKETEFFINGILKNILQILPKGSICGLTFAFGWLFYLVLLLLSIIIIPVLSGGLFAFNNVTNGFDYFMKENNDTLILLIIKLVVGIIITFSTFLIVGSANSISLFLKMLFYPLVIGAGDIILKIINQNFFVIRLILILMSIIFVSLISNNVNKSVYSGILIGYIPLLIYNLFILL